MRHEPPAFFGADDTDPSAVLVLSVHHSGDSDSIGAICGNLVGAASGDDGGGR
jgi:ADP-ribosylglycohydrolase